MNVAAFDAVELNPATNEAVLRRLPALPEALDSDVMGAALAAALTRGSAEITRCKPAGATYGPGPRCALRYDVDVVDARGTGTATVVNAHVFASGAEATRYTSGRLAPLAARLAGRPTPFARAVACLEPLPIAVSVFPVDGDLPTLVDAADPGVVGPLLDGAIPEAGGAWSVSLARYARGHRCVLRYQSDGHVVLGKVIGNGNGGTAHAVLRAIAATTRRPPPLTVPRSLGYAAALRLHLLAPVAGDQIHSRRIKEYLRRPLDDTAAVSAIESCAAIAAALHACPVDEGPQRRPEDDVARLGVALCDVHTLAPGLGRRLLDVLHAVGVRLHETEPVDARLCHGDFKHNQVLGEGADSTLIDFDTACAAEPALDLGQFLAYLRLKAADIGAGEAVEPLAARFVAAYAGAANLTEAEAHRLFERTAAFELLSLVGRAVHSWYKFKPDRLVTAMSVLDERLACETP